MTANPGGASFFPVPSDVIQQISWLGSEIRELETNANGNGAPEDVQARVERLKLERGELIRLVEEKFRRWWEVEVEGGPR